MARHSPPPYAPTLQQRLAVVRTRPAIKPPPRAARATSKIIGRLARKQGFAADPQLVENWSEIVGAQIARLAVPVKLKGRAGELVLRAAHGAAAAQLQHMAPQILSRINAFLGRGAAQRLSIVQGGARPRGRAGDRSAAAAPSGERTAPSPPSADVAEALARLRANIARKSARRD